MAYIGIERLAFTFEAAQNNGREALPPLPHRARATVLLVVALAYNGGLLKLRED